MRKGFLGLLLTVFGAGPAMAQMPYMNSAPLPPGYSGGSYPGVYMPVQDVPGLTDGYGAEGSGERAGAGLTRNPLQDAFWVDAELLLWTIKRGPEPTPIARTGPVVNSNTVPGYLGQPGSSTLLGGHDLDFPTFSGGRVNAGCWFDPATQVIGIEGSGFLLERRTISQSVSSDANGNPALSVPFVNASTGAEQAVALALPATPGIFSIPQAAGSALMTASSRFWGADANITGVLYRGDKTRVTLLTGARYMNLNETLELTYRTQGLLPRGETLFNPFPFFGGASVGLTNPGSQVVLTDNINGQTEFYGAQVGGRFEWYFSRFYLTVTGKTGLGISREVVDVNGHSELLLAAQGPLPLVYSGPTQLSGGIFSAGRNTGVFKDNEFAVFGELNTKLGIQIAYGLSAFIGYDFLIWDKTARPGEQINREVDPTQISINRTSFVSTGGKHPSAQAVSSTSFWAQGANVGLLYRY